MKRLYTRIIVLLMLFCGMATTANADSVRKLKRQTFYGDAQGAFGDIASRKIDYLYDKQNRLIRTVETTIDAYGQSWELTHYNKYEYDANSNLVQTSSLTYGLFDYGDFGYDESKDSVNYEYNDKNQCIKESHKYVVYEYTYDEQGRKLTSSKWNINSITGSMSNDLVETYSDFNAQGNPCTITATSPSGKSWNEYTGVITYNENGSKTSEAHYDSDGMMTMHETWTYDGDFLTEYIVYNVLDGQDMGGTKTIYTAVDGDKDRVMYNVYGSDEKGEYTEHFGGTDCLYEYDYFDGEVYSPTLVAEESAEGVNNVALTFSVPEIALMGAYASIYRNGVKVADEISLEELLGYDENEQPVARFTDNGVKNGYQEYVVVLKVMNGYDADDNIVMNSLNSSNIATVTLNTELPAATDLHVVSIRKDFDGNTFVTVGWTNPEMSEALEYQNTHLFFENMRIEENATTDPTVTELEADFGIETVKTVFVQTNYKFGRANSELFTIDLENYTGIKNLEPETRTLKPETYNLSGQRVSENYKGLVIKNGKKIVK